MPGFHGFHSKATPGKEISWRTERIPRLSNYKCQNKGTKKTWYLPSVQKNIPELRIGILDFLYVLLKLGALASSKTSLDLSRPFHLNILGSKYMILEGSRSCDILGCFSRGPVDPSLLQICRQHIDLNTPDM